MILAIKSAIFIALLIYILKKYGCEGFITVIVGMTIVVLAIFSQKYIGKIEGTLLVIIPSIIVLIIISTNNRFRPYWYKKMAQLLIFCDETVNKIFPKSKSNLKK